MTSLDLKFGTVLRLGVEAVLAMFTLWLVVQNAALLVIHPWKETPAPLVVALALLKVFVHVAAALWPWVLVAAPTAAVILLALARGLETSEVRHV